jgi:Alr-MurF fusion protein
MKLLAAKLLQTIAKRQIDRFHPMVIAVTGSVGKTSTKNAIAIALASTLDVRTANKNYNNEFGVPLAIFGEYSPGSDAWGWVKLIARQLVVKKFPKVLVLEYGADQLGDIQASCDIALPHIGVVTAISPVHVSNYPNLGALVEEKSTLVKNIPADGVVVLNADDVTVAQMRKKSIAPVATYGTSGHDAAITDIYTKIVEQDAYGTSDAPIITKASIVVEGETVNLALRNVLGSAAVSACAAALLVAKHCDVPLARAAKALNEHIASLPGRMRPLAGVKGCLILDDSYNAAPASTAAGLDVLDGFKVLRSSARRIAVLGTMAELGAYAEEEHSGVGRKVSAVADVFVAVGPMMSAAADVAIREGMKHENVVRCADSVAAGRWLDENVRAGDVVLIKGSQSARMEKAVKDILAEPMRASELLCRQEDAWLKS